MSSTTGMESKPAMLTQEELSLPRAQQEEARYVPHMTQEQRYAPSEEEMRYAYAPPIIIYRQTNSNLSFWCSLCCCVIILLLAIRGLMV